MTSIIQESRYTLKWFCNEDATEEQREETQRYIKELDKNIQIGIWENDDE